jgi:hypothetical protein
VSARCPDCHGSDEECPSTIKPAGPSATSPTNRSPLPGQITSLQDLPDDHLDGATTRARQPPRPQRSRPYGDFPQLVRRRQHTTFRYLVLAQSRVSNPEKTADLRTVVQATSVHRDDSHSPANRPLRSAETVLTTSDIDRVATACACSDNNRLPNAPADCSVRYRVVLAETTALQ